MRPSLFLPLLVAAAFAAPDAAFVKLQQEVAAIAKASGLDAGIAIQDLTNGDELLINGDEAYPQSSSIRIHLIVELFRQAAAKKISLDEICPLPASARVGGSGVLRFMGNNTVSMSLRDYAALIVTVNDNSATNFLIDRLGMDNINASLAAQGTPEIKFRRRAVSRFVEPNAPENVGTPRAVMRALELIHHGQVVDRATSDGILELLALPEISYFRRELPPGVRFAGRSGSGPNNRTEAGIVLLPGRPYVLCVMIKGLRGRPGVPRDYSKPDALIGEITRAAQNYFASKAPPRRGRASDT